MSILIVLFGQENEADGKLRVPAKTRCKKAAEVWRQLSPGSEVVILPTGAFGTHFNLSAHPHFYYLTQELIKLEVPPENILPGTVTSNTFQDCTEAWYRFKSGGYHKLIAVTSDYHAERVAFILGRLSADSDADIEVEIADTPSGYQGEDKRLEPQKVENLKREWVDVIRRNSKVAPERFVAAYQESGLEQRHYDTLSLAVVSALFIVNAFALTIVPGNSGWSLFIMLIAVAIIDLLLWSLYNRMAESARTARRVLTRMEFEHRMPGFSSNWRPQATEWFRTPPWLWSMKALVAALAVTLYVSLFVMALLARSEPEPNTSQSLSRTPVANSSTTPSASSDGNALDRWANAMMNSANNANSNANRRRGR